MSAQAPGPQIMRAAGDAALVLELEPRIDPDVNARAVAIANAIRQRTLAGVRDVIATYRTVAIFFHPLRTRLDDLTAALETIPSEPAHIQESRRIEIPIAYGGIDGPDLADVARQVRLSERRVVELHASQSYRVFMLGFVPGFAYMGSVDPAIAVPRRSSPRLAVPAGSVAIADGQTGVYPRETPGGWNLIGRTDAELFDPARVPPSLLLPGDAVRFVPVSAVQPRQLSRESHVASHSSRTITVLNGGLLTTVQDLGRWGYQGLGVPVAGPMDAMSHRLANLLVGNSEEATALEVTLAGPALRLESEATLTITGADLSPLLNDEAVPLNRPVVASRGSVLRFGARRSGARAYVAFDGGIDVPPVLGSRALHVPSGLGGFGRPLAAGDRIGLGERRSGAHSRHSIQLRPDTPDRVSVPAFGRTEERIAGARLRVLPGPQMDFFDESSIDVLQRQRFTISAQSNRMGYRLKGESAIASTGGQMISDATFEGGIQILPSGDPILLMADRQTTGGYPQIATVISADLPLAGQLAPGDWVEFVVCTRGEALSALIAEEGKLLAVR